MKATPKQQNGDRVPMLKSATLALPDGWHQLLPGPLMRVEESHSDGDVVVRAQIPDADPDRDIEVTVRDGVLRIHAERVRQAKLDEGGTARTELYSGSFTRSFHLPRGVDTTDVRASYHDGVLEVRAPVGRSEPETHEVAITRS